jgi:soluble lytic murein transglycosylase-like protein
VIQTRLRLIFVALVMVLAPSAAGAEILTLKGGRVMNVESVTFDGDTAKIILRGGGEIGMPRSFVESVAPDEVPYEPPMRPAPKLSTVAALEAVDAAPLAGTELARDGLLPLIDRLATLHGVNPKLAHALIQVESNYQPRAVSSKGAMGLMQLMPATARQYAVQDPFDPMQNLSAGLRHLRILLDRFGKGRESLALAAYNAGEGAVSRYGGIPPYRETQNYVRRILSLTGR